ncbi:Glyoxalase-like domain protein [compost metagenome]
MIEADKEELAVKFGYTIAYVPNVQDSLDFFGKAFGLPTRFLHESGDYGELETGATTLAFASHELGDLNLSGGHVHASDSPQPLGIEIALVTDDVHAAHQRALAAGAQELASPQARPWGQVVSYLRCPDGLLVELCSPMGA